MQTKLKLLGAGATACLLLACSPAKQDENTSQAAKPAATADKSATHAKPRTETDKLNHYFQERYEYRLSRSPMMKTYLGVKDGDYGKWDDNSLAHRIEDYQELQASYGYIQTHFDYAKLDKQGKLSWKLFSYNAQQAKDALPFMDYGYPFEQMYGAQSRIPAFLINQHRISSVDDAKAYISRLNTVDGYLGTAVETAKRRAKAGIKPPKFVYDRVLDASHNVIKGAPFNGEGDSPLFDDFKSKVAKLDIDDATKADLIAQAKTALTDKFGPAWQAMIAEMEAERETATTDDGVWKLPKGDEYYAMRLKQMTTTDMTADEIHQLGLAEVTRIHDEMRAIMQQVGYKGTLQEFFVFMREDPQFYYPDTDEGRAEYLAKATDIINTMRGRLDEIFITKPKADIIVKAVEPFREATAGKAFYQRGSLDGKRPGTYYANLYKMESMPTYQMEALAFHEGIPGHHMQLSIAQELTGIPMFRKLGHYTAYSEGWGLYSELLPKDMGGFYTDPYSDFGRLAMELWRAARLVVDTGIHSQHWTREQAIDYLVQNTPNSVSDATKAIERYIVMPGQATAYKIGMNKILDLRQHAKDELGDDFDIREFHDVILDSGPVPLDVLAQQVDDWIVKKQGA